LGNQRGLATGSDAMAALVPQLFLPYQDAGG
jgi:hypothetical protein